MSYRFRTKVYMALELAHKLFYPGTAYIIIYHTLLPSCQKLKTLENNKTHRFVRLRLLTLAPKSKLYDSTNYDNK